jgi:tripeptide aminopeptidase
MTDDGFRSDLARETAPRALERFVRYARIDTQADPESDTVPSTAKQLDLSRLLVEELQALGVADAALDEQGFVLATLPATVDRPVPVIALVAHVDTAPDAPGANVRPQVIRFEGERVPLAGEVALDPEVSPKLMDHVGHELVTTDGTTLLGADDKAGVAAIMAAAEHLLAHPEIEHGPIRICFTRDEEIGKGVEGLDLDVLGAEAAYTLDGSTAGEVENETFTARQATVTFTGVAVHPGMAKDRLVNALKVAGHFLAALPAAVSPEGTDGRDGFVHPWRASGNSEVYSVVVIVRGFDDVTLDEEEALLRRLAGEAVAAFPGSSVEIDVVEQYRNMKEYLDDHPRVVEAALEAVRRTGIEPTLHEIRGGTDGSRLSELGLPTPNLPTGGHDFHGRSEWICVADLGAAVATIVHLAQIWAE